MTLFITFYAKIEVYICGDKLINLFPTETCMSKHRGILREVNK